MSNFHKSRFLCHEYGRLIREKGCHVNSISLRLINDAETFCGITSIKLNKLLHPNCFDRKVTAFDLSLSVRVLFLFSLFFFYWNAQSKLNWKLFKIILKHWKQVKLKRSVRVRLKAFDNPFKHCRVHSVHFLSWIRSCMTKVERKHYPRSTTRGLK